MGQDGQRLLVERAVETGNGCARDTKVRAHRSVTVNLTESPLGWLFARALVTQRQFDAGERLRADWGDRSFQRESTMDWDAAPVARGRGGSGGAPDLTGAQIDAKRRFDGAIDAARRLRW